MKISTNPEKETTLARGLLDNIENVDYLENPTHF